MISQKILDDLENAKAKVDTAQTAHRMEEGTLTEQAIYLNGIRHDLKRIADELVKQGKEQGEWDEGEAAGDEEVPGGK